MGGGGGGGLLGTILNVVSFAVPVLRPIAIGYNMINAAANDNPLGMLTAGLSASGAFSDFGGFDGATDGYGMGDFGGAGDFIGGSPELLGDASGNWAGTAFEGTVDDPFLGSEGLQNAVDVDSNAWTELVGDTVKGFDSSLGSSGVTGSNMSAGLADFGSTNPLQNVGSFSPDTSSIGAVQPDAFGASAGTGFEGASTGMDTTSMGELPTEMGTTPTTLEGIGSGQGISATGGTQGFQPQKYTYENKDFFSGRTGTGMNITPGQTELYNNNLINAEVGTPKFTQGLEMNNLPDIFKKLTTSVGGASKRAPTPLEWGGKTLGALGNMYANNQAMGLMKDQMSRANNWQDPNRARGDFANQQWQQSFSDPRQAYNEFMGGSGREFTDQARAMAAKSGRRGGYLNSGRMNSDLASMFMKQLPQHRQSIAGGFSAGNNNYASTASAAPGYASMIRNQFQPLGDLFGQYQNYDQTFGSSYS